MKRTLLSIATLAAVACIFWIGFEVFFGASLRNAASKDALHQIHREVDVGASQETVLSIYERDKTDRTNIKKDLFSDTWVVGMPFELGATDPILYVQFGPDKRVTAVAMRTSDGIHLAPPIDYRDKGVLNLPK